MGAKIDQLRSDTQSDTQTDMNTNLRSYIYDQLKWKNLGRHAILSPVFKGLAVVGLNVEGAFRASIALAKNERNRGLLLCWPNYLDV